MAEGRVVKVQKAPQQQATIQPFKAVDLLEEFCYLYPRYSFEEARRMPHFRICRMVRKARKLQGQHYLNLTQITAAPYSRGGDLYDKLIEQFREQANG